MQKAWNILLILLVIIGFLPFILLSTSAFPAIDDFPCSLAARDAGLITSVVTWYKIWTARYFAVFMWWLCPLVWYWESGYQLTSSFVVCGHVLSIAGFLFLVKKWIPLTTGRIWILALSLTLLYISIVPSIAEGLYYYNGLVCYQPSAMFLLLALGFLIRFWHSSDIQQIKTWFELATAGLLIFCIIGSNESAMLSITVIVSGFWLHSVRIRKSIPTLYTFLIIEILVLDAVVFFSPATSLRMQASAAETRSIFWVVESSLHYCGSFVMLLLLNPFFYLISFVLVWFSPKIKDPLTEIHWLIGCLVVSYIASHFPSFLGEGVVQGRTANFNAYLFLLVWLVLLYGLKQQITILRFSPVVLGVIGLLFCANFFVFPKWKNNVFLAYSDLVSGLAQQHKEEVESRVAYLKSNNSDSIQVPPYQYFPTSTFVSDLVPPDGNTAHNAFYARYFGKKFIELKTTYGTGNRKPD